MEATLKALADLLLEAVPTIVFFLFLAWYLKRVFFSPMAAILDERRKQTEGVRELAQRAFEAADQKQSEFDRALELARAEIYGDHEKLRREWAAEQAQSIAQARARVDEQIDQAHREIAQEADRTQTDLDSAIDSLSQQIVDRLLARRAA